MPVSSFRDVDRYVLFARDPFEVIVSGYTYHRDAKEKWCAQPYSQLGSHWPVLEKSVLAVFRHPVWARQIPSIGQQESYSQFLQRLPLLQGLTAEMFRALVYPIQSLADDVDQARFRNQVVVCLPEFDVEVSCLRAWERIFRHLALPGVDVAEAVAKAEKTCPFHIESHRHISTLNETAKLNLYREVMTLDRKLLGGTIAVLAKVIGCRRKDYLAI